jgi:hypothetical protein
MSLFKMRGDIRMDNYFKKHILGSNHNNKKYIVICD